MKKIFIICSVRNTTLDYIKKLEFYVSKLESSGNSVHLPHRDTNQGATSLAICKQNKQAIENADEVHIFYSAKSQGTHFDMGVAFALDKKLIIVENEEFDFTQKSFPLMLEQWSKLD